MTYTRVPPVFSPERVQELSAGYDLDCGGFEFETLAVEGRPDLLGYEDPDGDYIPWIYDGESEDGKGFWDLGPTVYVFAPYDYDVKWPTSHKALCGSTYYYQFGGVLHDSDHSCYCDPDDRTQEVDGEPSCGRPGCLSGFIDSAGGSWAIYSNDAPAGVLVEEYIERVEEGLAGMKYVSFGTCPGCAECREVHGPSPTDLEPTFDGLRLSKYDVEHRKIILPHVELDNFHDAYILGLAESTAEMAADITARVIGEHKAEKKADELIENGDAFDEGSFSYGSCGICGCTYGGDRYDYHWVDDDGNIWHENDGCTDCLVYLSNGETPDPENLDWI